MNSSKKIPLVVLRRKINVPIKYLSSTNILSFIDYFLTSIILAYLFI